MMLGLLLAAAIVCSNIFLFEHTRSVKKELKSEKAKEEQTPSFTAAPTITTPPTSVHVQFNVASYCLFEIGTAPEKEEQVASDITSYPSRFFLTLFRVIISPNAP